MNFFAFNMRSITLYLLFISMKIYSIICAGKDHPVNGEDAKYQHHLANKWFIGAVMDGCSSGKESHFASTLYVKSLHKTCRMLPKMKEIMEGFDLEFMEKEAIMEFILGQLFEDVKKVKRTLFLDIEEILSTLIIMVYDKTNQAALVNISGDGLVACNGNTEEIDQNNIPDYMGYHLDLKFEKWYRHHTISKEFNQIEDLSISTDGLIKLRKNPMSNLGEIDPIAYFLLRQPPSDQPNQLQKLLGKLIEKNDYIPFDDICVIRLKNK